MTAFVDHIRLQFLGMWMVSDTIARSVHLPLTEGA